MPVSAETIAALLKRIADGTVSNNAAKQVFEKLWEPASSEAKTHDASGDLVGEGSVLSGMSQVDAIIEAKGLKQMNDSGALEKIIDEVMVANAPMVEQFRAGKDKAFNALVGLVMKASKGKANPQQVNDVLKQKLQ